MRAPLPANEGDRLAALLDLGLLDTPPEASFDDVARLAGQLCEAPIALVSLVDADRQWFKARVGLDIAQTPRDASFCAHALAARDVLVVRDTLEDARFADNPFVRGDPNIRFYAGAPLVIAPDVTVGTLCVLDRVPRDLTPAQVEALAALARQVSAELRLRRALSSVRPSAVSPEAASGQRAVEGRLVAGRYRLERVLGVGAMGIVVAALDEVAGERVAIKFLQRGQGDEREAQERFVREARAVLAVGGDHVARVRDVGNLGGGAPFIVMEHLDGEDLERRLERDGPLPAAEALAYVRQACEAVGRAHAAGIVHRDLKPANLFLTRAADGAPLVKVLDFGVSKLSGAGRAADDARLTRGSALLGSPYYMSPEQLRGSDDVDARADIWSLGVIVYELVSGELPFEGASLADLCSAVLRETPRTLAERGVDAPPGLDAVIARCLARARDERYPTVEALSAALDAVGRPARAAAPRPPRRRPTRTRWPTVPLVAALLALLAAVVWIMARSAQVAPGR